MECKNKLTAVFLTLFSMLLVSCGQQPAEKALQYSSSPTTATVQDYRLAPHPLYNPQKLGEAFYPLVDLLNMNLAGARIELESSRDYQAYEQKIYAREPAILMPNPWQTLVAIKAGYHVIAMWGDAEDFKGIIVVRKDSNIKMPADLKGKTVSYPSPTALAAAIMPQYFLYKNGLNINRDVHNVYVGSQESSIMNVYLGHAVAGATWPPPWRLFQKEHPTEAGMLKVIWETPSLLNNSVMVRDDVPESVREQIRRTLLRLGETSQGRSILAGMETSRFYAADDASYDVVRRYVARFEKEVRPVERK